MEQTLPNATLSHRPDTTALRAGLEAAGWTFAEAALLAGVTERTLQRYLSPTSAARGHVIPYPLQFTLEAIARHPRTVRRSRERKRGVVPAKPPPRRPAWQERLRAKNKGANDEH